MLKVILVVCFLIAFGFVISGFLEVKNAPDLFEKPSVDSDEVHDE